MSPTEFSFEALNLMLVLPELFLVVGAMVLLMAGVFVKDKTNNLITSFSIILIIITIFLLLYLIDEGYAVHSAFIIDPFAKLMKLLVLIASGVIIIISSNCARKDFFDHFEYPVLILIATTGMMLMISANDLIVLYLGLELQSLSLYVIAAINRDSLRSTEAGLKYFVLGALSSGILLYGISLIYGFTGQTGFNEIEEVISGTNRSIGLIFGMVFLLTGISFKISAVPFHMWTPDVYEGAPTPVTAFFSVAPKIAALAVLIRILLHPLESLVNDWQQIIIFISIASMILASFAAINQKNIKRLMAYSSIGHMGYALIGLAAGTHTGISGIILYILVYMVMVLGTFACILSMRCRDGLVENITDLSGLSSKNPVFALFLTALMFSLAGIPPLAGFFAKYFIFLTAIEADLIFLAVIGVMASLISTYYYLRIVKIMWFNTPKRDFVPIGIELRLILGISGLFIVVLYNLTAGSLAEITSLAAKSFF